MKVKTRIAPSPTGFLHVGTAQSALYNWLFAHKNKGEFNLRIEDTDKARSTKKAEKNIIEGLIWLGLKWDGDISHSTDNQSRYTKLLEQLIKEGRAFYCHHSQEELEAERKNQESDKQAPLHACEHKNTNKGKETRGIIRLAVDEKSDRLIVFDDQVRGRVEFKQSLLGDFSIARSINDALYHFAVVVDDIDMKITHVLRGEDHISNTPKQILIYEALGKDVPQFAHWPSILAPDRSKLSKRNGVTSISDYKKDYLPEVIINFLGILGYTFSKEIISREEMAQEFELSKVHKSGAMFDIKKLNWLNSQYIKKLPPEEFKRIASVPELPDEAVPLVIERLEKLSDVQNFDYFWKEPEYDKSLLRWKNMEVKDIINSVSASIVIVGKIGLDNKTELRSELDKLAKEKFEGNRGAVYWPLRVSLTGKERSPDPVEIASILGPKETQERLNEAKKKLES